MRTLLLSIFLVPAILTAQLLNVSDTLRFLALGDSYTIGQSVGPGERWPQQLSDSLASRGKVTDTLSYIATTGWRTDDLLNASSNQDLQSRRYNFVSLLIGVNNQYQAKPFSQYIVEFPALLDSAIQYAGGDKTHVFVVSIPDYAYTPFGQQSPNPAQISTQIDQYNQYNNQVADSMGVVYFDITAISRQGLQNPAYVAGDGLHPSGAQYAQWVKLMLAFIDSEIIVSGYAENNAGNSDLVISPNPANEYVALSGMKNEKQVLEFYNAAGSLVLKQSLAGSSARLNVAGLENGFYTLKIISGSGAVVKKFVKTN